MIKHPRNGKGNGFPVCSGGVFCLKTVNNLIFSNLQGGILYQSNVAVMVQLHAGGRA